MENFVLETLRIEVDKVIPLFTPVELLFQSFPLYYTKRTDDYSTITSTKSDLPFYLLLKILLLPIFILNTHNPHPISPRSHHCIRIAVSTDVR